MSINNNISRDGISINTGKILEETLSLAQTILKEVEIIVE